METLDSIPLAILFTANRVKKFFEVDGVWLEEEELAIRLGYVEGGAEEEPQERTVKYPREEEIP